MVIDNANRNSQENVYLIIYSYKVVCDYFCLLLSFRYKNFRRHSYFYATALLLVSKSTRYDLILQELEHRNMRNCNAQNVFREIPQ